MTTYDILLAAGAILAALAVGAVCCVGLIVWLSGRPPRIRTPHG